MKIAAVQMDIHLARVEDNLDKIVERIRETTGQGARLAVFPECAVTGYCFGSLDEARPFAQSIPGPATERVRRACEEFQCHAIFGMLESVGEKIFNAAVFVGPQGVIGSYRKVHLPYLGIDMHTTPGDRAFAVHDAPGVRIGLNICYDASFPEAARSLALLGAELVVLPTNWPPGSECVAAHVINTRALENSIYYSAVNRVGTEEGFTFIGGSRICDPSGNTLAEAEGGDEKILYAEIDPEKARRKHIVRVPGKHEIHRFADRRPEMYDVLTRGHNIKRVHSDSQTR